MEKQNFPKNKDFLPNTILEIDIDAANSKCVKANLLNLISYVVSSKNVKTTRPYHNSVLLKKTG